MYTEFYEATENKFEILSKLGEGSYGKVYRICDKTSKQEYALKCTPYSIRETNGVPAEVLREVNSNLVVNSEFVIKLLDTKLSKNYVFLFFELMECDLFRLIDKSVLKKGFTRECMRCILTGLRDLHACGIVHRDLKPGNVLVSNNAIKIADLGFSKEFLGTLRNNSSRIG